MGNEFKPGTKVHVEFDGVVEVPRPGDLMPPESLGLYDRTSGRYGFVKVAGTGGTYHYVWVPHDGISSGCQVMKVERPSDWDVFGPAQIGDVWEADGNEYLVGSNGGGDLYTFCADDPSLDPSGDNGLAAKNPQLVRRRGGFTR